jgi:hypothetical protein
MKFAVLLLLAVVFPQYRTLQSVLQENGVTKVSGIPSEVLQRHTRNVDTIRNGETLILATQLTTKELKPGEPFNDATIHIVTVDMKSGKLKYAALKSKTFGGSLMDVHATKNYLYTDAHLNPSASYMFVLSRDLKYLHELYGYPIKVVNNDTIVFHNSQIHFAPVHRAELSVYDPVRRVERTIYPPAKPDPVRTEFVEHINAAAAKRGEAWFREHNFPMDPGFFDSSLGKVVMDERTHTLAFEIVYGNPINDANDPDSDRREVVTTCVSMDHVEKIVCKERPVEAWAAVLKVPPSADEILLTRAASNPSLIP